MNLIDRLYDVAREKVRRVVLPEGSDPRVLQAAVRLRDEQLADPVLLGPADQIQSAAREARLSLDGLVCHDPADDPLLDELVEAYRARRDVKAGIARRMVRRPLFFGGMLVARGRADAMVAGVAHATATVIQAGVLTIGMGEGIETPSSFFLMVLPEFNGQKNHPLIFADCAVNVDPTAEQLADIALASRASAGKLLTESPRVAMLSFATQGSAAHPMVEKVTEALALVRQRDANADIDGEFQADAALIPSVASKKIKRESGVAGQANVLIFPDLNSGNISYKLTQYLGGAQAIGPFLQGFAKPISDLSRGASSDDIVATTTVVLTMA